MNRLLITLIALAILLLSIAPVHALERCLKYSRDVQRYHAQYFGVDFPAGYSVAQLHAESLCRESILSGDGIGSEGPAQITFRLWRERLEAEGIAEIHSIPNHLRAQAYINRDAYDRAACPRLWVMYQIYNGGTLVNREIARAGSCRWQDALQHCERHAINVGKGQRRSACDINYEYSQRIHGLGKLYRADDGDGYRFW